MYNNISRTLLVLSIPLAILIAVVSCVGIYTPDFYSNETFNWQVQSIGQDTIDLFVVVPVLLATSILAYRKSYTASLLWAGTTLYILYTFIIYSFDIHFNRLFIVYCLILGLSVYSFIWFIYTQVKNPVLTGINKKAVIKVTGVYLLIIAFAFYFLWLSEIIPAIIANTTPANLAAIGLFTNPVQALDLSVVLPGIFITGGLILKSRPIGYLFGAIVLTFFILMDITISWLAILMKQKGLESNISVPIVMSVLAFVSLGMLLWNIKNFKIKGYERAK